MMYGSTVESVWIPNYGTGLRVSDLPLKPKLPNRVDTRGLRRSSVRHQSSVSRPSKRRINAERRYVACLSAELSFDDDVVRDRCFQTDPFDSQFKSSMNQTRRLSSKRHRNDISYLNKPVDPNSYLRPVKPARPSCVKSESATASSKNAKGSQPADVPRRDSDEVSLPRRKSATDNNIPSDEQENTAEWDECLVLKLSANTARWLIQNPSTSEDARSRLHKILDAVHGPAKIDNQVELVEETHSETNAATVSDTVKKPWLGRKGMLVSIFYTVIFI